MFYLLLYTFTCWEKFGENEHRPQIITIQNEDAWQRVVKDETVVVKDTRIFNDDVLEVSVMKKQDACEGAEKTNIFIASFTTALARPKLYEELQKLEKQVLYYDTDSVIYRWREGQPYIPTGHFLGQMTDELEGDPIVEFGSTGPKSYCYRTQGEKKECKNKGTKSSYKINQVLNCGSMMQHIQREMTNPLDSRRLMDIKIKNHFVRENTHKTVRLQHLVKFFV